MARQKVPLNAPKVNNLQEAQQVIDVLWQELQDIEDRLASTSRNSSRPPSGDGPSAPARQRKPSGKSRGAQVGHKGSKRMLVDEVDTPHQHKPPSVCVCGGEIALSKAPYRRHQVFDIPEQAYSVVEHQLCAGYCTHCGECHRAQLPDTVPSGQMGINLLAYVAVQSGQFHQSISQIQQQLIQNFGLHFSRGAISEAQGKVSAMMTPAYQGVKQALLASDIVHADETRHKRNNENRWMWQMCTDQLSCFMTYYCRGQVAAKQLLGEQPEMIVVTDQYAGYHFIGEEQRQLCWAHILRNVSALADSWGMNHQIGQQLEQLVLLIFRTRHRFEKDAIAEPIYRRRMDRLRQRWQHVLEQGERLCETPRYRNRCSLLLKQQSMCWTFLSDHRIPLLWRKGSYGVWSHRGEQFRQRILMIVETCRKLGANPLQWLRQIVRSVIEKTAYPSLPELTALTQ